MKRAEDAIWCAAGARRLAEEAGLPERAAVAIGIAMGELVTNAVKYAGGGEVTIERLTTPRAGMRLLVEDRGPGIADLERAMQDGVSEGHTAEDRPRGTPKRGLGSGLGAVKRLLDEVRIEPREGGGTRVTGIKWAKV